MLSRPGTLSNLLADLLPDAPRIARILVAAAQDHIADELREHISAGMDPVTASRLAATVFADATMFPLDACAWVVGEFALALGLASDNNAPPIKFSPSVTAVMAGDPPKPTPVAGPDKSTQPASTEPPAPVHAGGRAGGAAVGPGRREGRGRQRGGADPGGRIKAPFPAAAGLSPDRGAAGAGALGVVPAGPGQPGAPGPGPGSGAGRAPDAGAGQPGAPGAGPAGASPAIGPAATIAEVAEPQGAEVASPAAGAPQAEPRPAQAEAAQAGAAQAAAAQAGGAQAGGAQAGGAQVGTAQAGGAPTGATPTGAAQAGADGGANASVPAGPAEVSAPTGPARTKAIWTAVVSADRAYFDGVIANGHVDAASIKFPSHYPERHFELRGTEMRIGRRSVSRRLEPEIDLAGPPTDPGISHLHAVLIAQDDGTWAVIDRGSSNGTLVNGREIESDQPIPLRDGDRVCLGAWTALTFHSNLPT